MRSAPTRCRLPPRAGQNGASLPRPGAAPASCCESTRFDNVRPPEASEARGSIPLPPSEASSGISTPWIFSAIRNEFLRTLQNAAVLPFRADGWMHGRAREERLHIVRGEVRAVRLLLLARPFLLAQLITRLGMELPSDFYIPARRSL